MGLDSSSASPSYYLGLFEAVAGFALGTSIVSIFTRMSGGVFSAAAEVGAELVGKLEGGIPYQSPRNPATVTEIVG
jgi:Na+/H+-translocating membrane pyrophosphatase